MEGENVNNGRILKQNERGREVAQVEGSIVHPILVDCEHAETTVTWRKRICSEL